MKIEDAIEIIADEINKHWESREYEALIMAKAALEKQMPEEPIILLKDEEGYEYQFEHYLCPDCKNIFEQRPQGSKVPLHTPKYCPDCGQRLK